MTRVGAFALEVVFVACIAVAACAATVGLRCEKLARRLRGGP